MELLNCETSECSVIAHLGRFLAEERGITITKLLEEFASRELTEAEREQRAAEAARELGIQYTEQV